MFCTNCGAPVSGGFCTNCGTRQAQGTPVPQMPQPGYIPAASALPALPYATWASRVAAYLIDMAIVFGLIVILGLVAGLLGVSFLSLDAITRGHGGFGGPACCCLLGLFPAAQLIVGIYNRVFLVARRGYSIGQGVMKLKTVDGYGNLLSVGTLVLRLIVQALLSFIPVLGLLDMLWPLWDERRQTLHDKAVGSYVIDNPDRAAPVF
jgi:uncharacterized RDD family membrane protein YckC